MNLDRIVENYAQEINGQVIHYTDKQSVIVIPLNNGRFQNVFGLVRYGKKYKILEFDSRVCDFSDDINLSSLLENAQNFCFSRLIKKDGYLEVAAAVVVKHSNENIIKDIIYEVATRADLLENYLTGKDIH